MATTIRAIGHEDRLSLVDHLDELRTRLIVSAIALAVAFGFCLWQNHALLHLINAPLSKQTEKQVAKGNGPLGQTALAQQAVLKIAHSTEGVVVALSAPSSGLPAATRAALAAEIPSLRAAVAKVPHTPEGNKPVTLGIGEPFTTTITVTLLFALVISLPVILFELYGFVLPAFSPKERRIAMPLLISIPFLFVIGVAFGYFVVLPAALRFFQNFNSSEFNVLVQAAPYYKFVATILLAMGLVFQVPVAILAATRDGGLPAGRRRDAGPGDRAAVHPLRAEHPRRVVRRAPRRQTRTGRSRARVRGRRPRARGCCWWGWRRTDSHALAAGGGRLRAAGRRVPRGREYGCERYGCADPGFAARGGTGGRWRRRGEHRRGRRYPRCPRGRARRRDGARREADHRPHRPRAVLGAGLVRGLWSSA
jgi:sec-independent protein translocase protein TatC